MNIPPLNENEMEHYVQRIERRIEQTPALRVLSEITSPYEEDVISFSA